MDRKRRRAALGSVAFFLVAPCVVAGVLPWLVSGWSMSEPSGVGWVRVAAGGALILGCLVVLVRAFARFVREGLGTPAPVAPTERLVVGGDYRFVRNPMYVAVVGIVLGQALLLASIPLLAYAVVGWLVMASFVRWYEEPVLHETYGAEYDRYREAVRAWWPRLRPWTQT